MKAATGPDCRNTEQRNDRNGTSRRNLKKAIIGASLLALAITGRADVAQTQSGQTGPGMGPGRWVLVPAAPGGGPMPPSAAGQWQRYDAAPPAYQQQMGPGMGTGRWVQVPAAPWGGPMMPPAMPSTPGMGAGHWERVPVAPGGVPQPPVASGMGAGHWQFVPVQPGIVPWWQSQGVAAARQNREPIPEAPARAAADKELAAYDRDRWNPIHFQPLIDEASNEQCLACHADVLADKPLDSSPAGVSAADSKAWYQTLDTYAGPQSTFHTRHMSSDFAKEVMELKCNFCHQGNDPREEAPNTHLENQGDSSFALRKSVDPETSCLRCHGRFSYEHMTGLTGPWTEARGDFEDPENPDLRNGCLSCHKETYRTVRHQVTYLKPENIEKLAAEGSSDVCYGCHGGRQWYRTGYPYPRHDWPGMQDVVSETPDWAVSRPKQSEERYRRPEK